MRSGPPPRRAFIVRHGNTFAPVGTPRRIGARTDLPLVESGRMQADHLGAWFRASDITFDRVLVSPLLRTRETAARIAPGLPLISTDWLREIDHGPDEGRTEAEVVARIGGSALDAWETEAVAPTGWITDAEPRLSAWRAWLSGSGGTDLVVTSNGAARFALLAMGLPPAKLRTGAFGEIVWTASGPQLVRWDMRPPAR